MPQITEKFFCPSVSNDMCGSTEVLKRIEPYIRSGHAIKAAIESTGNMWIMYDALKDVVDLVLEHGPSSCKIYPVTNKRPYIPRTLV